MEQKAMGSRRCCHAEQPELSQKNTQALVQKRGVQKARGAKRKKKKKYLRLETISSNAHVVNFPYTDDATMNKDNNNVSTRRLTTEVTSFAITNVFADSQVHFCCHPLEGVTSCPPKILIKISSNFSAFK